MPARNDAGAAVCPPEATGDSVIATGNAYQRGGGKRLQYKPSVARRMGDAANCSSDAWFGDEVLGLVRKQDSHGGVVAMPTPEDLHARLPLSGSAARTVMQGREALRNILDRKDPRMFVIVGPCSIHDPVAGLDYARRLSKLQEKVGDTLLVFMQQT